MAKRAKKINVFPRGSKWIAQKVGSMRPSAIRNTKKDAYRAAREVALNQGLDIVVYDRYGKYEKTITPQDNVDEGCFLTTACIKYYQLDDNCYELKTLRNFRDNYLLKQKATIRLVQQYYHLAPKVVSCLEASASKEILYSEVFSHVKEACIYIELKNYKRATQIYTQAIYNLVMRFNLN